MYSVEPYQASAAVTRVHGDQSKGLDQHGLDGVAGFHEVSSLPQQGYGGTEKSLGPCGYSLAPAETIRSKSF